MKRLHIVVLAVVMALLVASATQSIALMDWERGQRIFITHLIGYEAVPPILTPATANLIMKLSHDQTSLDFAITYINLTGDPTEIHLQFGQRGVNGGVILHLCGHEVPCPLGGSNTVTGTLTADDIDGAPSQGLAPGDFAGFLQVLRAGMVYSNIATTTHPLSEIRGQVR